MTSTKARQPRKTIDDRLSRHQFTKETAIKSYPCSAQCGRRIKKEDEYYTKPYHLKRRTIGKVRLHNLDECYDDWHENTLTSIINTRKAFNALDD